MFITPQVISSRPQVTNSATRSESEVTREMIQGLAALYLDGLDAHAPLAAPLYAELRGLPPLLIQVGTAEVLYDDATRLAARAREAGVPVTLEPWDDMIHVWHLFPDELPEASRAIARIGAFAREHGA